jgi:hypothetical protein
MTHPYRPPTSASDLATWTHHELRDEIERLRVENWQLKGALGYSVPGHIMDNSDFKCGLCEAKTISLIEAEAEIERLRGLLLV